MLSLSISEQTNFFNLIETAKNEINCFIIFTAILQVNELPASNHILENIFSYPWHINTKYYTADINLCITNDRTIGNREFAKSVGAIVITFDTNQVKHLLFFQCSIIVIPFQFQFLKQYY